MYSILLYSCVYLYCVGIFYSFMVFYCYMYEDCSLIDYTVSGYSSCFLFCVKTSTVLSPISLDTYMPRFSLKITPLFSLVINCLYMFYYYCYLFVIYIPGWSRTHCIDQAVFVLAQCQNYRCMTLCPTLFRTFIVRLKSNLWLDIQLNWQNACLGCKKPQILSLSLHKPSVVAHIGNLNIQAVKARGSKVQGYPLLDAIYGIQCQPGLPETLPQKQKKRKQTPLKPSL